MCWEDLTIYVAMPHKGNPIQKCGFLSCTGNGCWRLFLSSLQFWWLQDDLGNKDSAEISLHFPQAQLLTLDILRLAIQWALSLWKQCVKYILFKTRSIYLLARSLNSSFPVASYEMKLMRMKQTLSWDIFSHGLYLKISLLGKRIRTSPSWHQKGIKGTYRQRIQATVTPCALPLAISENLAM